MTNFSQSPEQLGTVAANLSMHGACSHVKRNNLTVHDYAALTDAIRTLCKQSVFQAIDDAKEAIACGMAAVAEHPFRASMTKAGSDAVLVCLENGTVTAATDKLS